MIDICKDICQCNQCDIEQEDCELAKAYEKQIPKQVKEYDKDISVFTCPSCGEWILYSDERETHKFCLECGQALKHEECEMEEGDE